MKLLFFIPAIVQMLLVLRLVWTGLARRYPAFTLWMALLAISALALLAYPSTRGTGYRNAWIVTQIISMLSLFAALTELTNRILEHYPGLRRITASGLFGILLATAIVAAANESIDKPTRLFVMMQSGWNAATALYVIVLVALATYLDPLRRKNVILHERVFAASCAASAASLFFAVMYQDQKEIGTWLGWAGGVIFPLLWMGMTRLGEVDRRPAVPAMTSYPTITATQATLDRLEKMVTRSGD